MTPEEIERLMALQMQLGQQPQAASVPPPRPMPQQNGEPALDARVEALANRQDNSPPPAAALPAGAPAQRPAASGNPILAGNDALRALFYAHPELAPPNDPSWLDEREAHLLGHDAAPAAISVAAPAPAPAPRPLPPPMLPAEPGSGAPAAPRSFVPPPAPPPPPMQVAPHPLADAPSAAVIAPLPQQAPLLSSLSPAPKAPASPQIDGRVSPAERTFAPAYQPPALPSFLNASLVPNAGAYKPAPIMPGYGLARTGNPFRSPVAAAPLLPDFANPFASPAAGGGGIGGGGIGSGIGSGGAADVLPGQAYDTSLFGQYLAPRTTPQF